MELQFNKTEHQCLKRASRSVANQELTQEVRLTEGMPDIGRVLSTWGQMVLRSKEWRGDTVTVTGGVMAWILYAPEDGTEPRSIDTWLPFQLKWEHMDSQREGPVRISPLLRFVDARTVAARKFMIRAGASALAEALWEDSFRIAVPEEVPEDVALLRRVYPVRLPKEAGEKTFILDEELNLPGGPAQKILSYTVHPDITDRRVMGDKVVFRGHGELHLVYRGEDGRIRTHDFEVPFSQFQELSREYSPDAQADIWMAATNLELEPMDDGRLRLKCGLVAQYLVDDRFLMELVEDAYSNRRILQSHREALNLPVLLERREETVHAEHILAGHQGEPVDVSFVPEYPVQRRYEDQTEMELAGSIQALYYDGDGRPCSASARWEGKTAVPAGEDVELLTQLLPVGGIQTVNSAEGMILSGQFRLQTDAVGGAPMEMVTGLELGDLMEPPRDRPSLILCRRGEDSLWEIAKRCGSTVEKIEEANGLTEIPSSGQLLLIPVS